MCVDFIPMSRDQYIAYLEAAAKANLGPGLNWADLALIEDRLNVRRLRD